MKADKQQQLLFFVNGPVPTAEDLANAKALGTLCFRNARHRSTPPKAGCRVAGAVPENYAKSKLVTVVPLPSGVASQQQDKNRR